MKKIKLSPSGKTFNCEEGQTVLSALEKNGLFLPNNCRAGACGECKIKVLKGEFDQGFILDMALSQEERSKGYGLMCMAKVLSEELEIEYANDDAKPKLFPPEENRTFIVTEKIPLSAKIVRLKMRSLGKPMRFWPGQYITLGDDMKRIPFKSYSIANIPNQDGEISLMVTKLQNGVTSTWIHDEVKVGDMVRLNGPYGTFIGDPQADTPVLCLAAGSGLAPIMSLASAALMRGGFKHPATILFSASTENDLLEIGHFKFMEAKFRNFEFKATLTKEKKDGYLNGRIPEILPSLYQDLSKTSVYIAGSPEFVNACKNAVLKLGAKEDLIHEEGFFEQKSNSFF